MRRIFLVLLTLAFGTFAAEAALEVTRSTAPNIKRGDVLADDAVLNVPEGAEIQLLKTPENTTHTVKGPHSGTLKDYLGHCSIWNALLGRCRRGGGEVDGGTRGAAPVPGGVRSLRPDSRE